MFKDLILKSTLFTRVTAFLSIVIGFLWAFLAVMGKSLAFQNPESTLNLLLQLLIVVVLAFSASMVWTVVHHTSKNPLGGEINED